MIKESMNEKLAQFRAGEVTQKEMIAFVEDLSQECKDSATK